MGKRRPNPIDTTMLRVYAPMDMPMEVLGTNLFDSLATTGVLGSGMAVSADRGSPHSVPGPYGWAQKGAIWRADDRGGGGARGNYPTGVWTESFGGRFQAPPNTRITILDRIGAGNSQFFVFTSGSDIIAGGYSVAGGYWVGSPTFSRVVGTWPNDGQFHAFAFTLTNDTSGVAGGIVTTYIDGIGQTPVAGDAAGYYFGPDQLYSYFGGFNGTVDPASAVCDYFIYDRDASAEFPAFAA